jgi:hypothetical protein
MILLWAEVTVPRQSTERVGGSLLRRQVLVSLC